MGGGAFLSCSFWLLTWYLTQLMCSLPVCRILKPRAEESGEYLCVFVFSNSPVANATIEVRGTFFFVVVFFCLLSLKEKCFHCLWHSVFVQEGLVCPSLQQQVCIQSLVITSEEVLHKIPEVRSHQCRNMNIALMEGTEVPSSFCAPLAVLAITKDRACPAG